MSFPISPVPVGPRLGTAPSSPTVGRRAQRSAPRVSERSSLSWPDSPAAFAPRPVQPATRREAGWHGPLSPEAQARLYLEILEESDYAERLAPVVGGDHRDVLDIGAGNGALSRRCLARPARWLAVEPNVAMGEALARLRPQSFIVDLASRPGGTDFDAARRLGHRAIHALSLPAACAPETAGEAVAQTVCDMIGQREEAS